MRIVSPDKLQCARLCVGRRESLDENVRVEADPLSNSVNVCQQILAVNNDSISLHDLRSGLTTNIATAATNVVRNGCARIPESIKRKAGEHAL